MRNLILTIVLINTISNQLFSQEIIKMTKEGGVYTIPCIVNGLRLKFIFDTGASDVSISLTEAIFMIKNGYLSEKDIKGSTYHQIANGEIVEGTTINIRELKIGNKVLYNVQASIVHSLSSPLLLGQSALSKIGKFSFDYSSNTLLLGGDNYNAANYQNSDFRDNNNENRIYTTTLKMEGRLRNGEGPASDVIRYIPSGATVRIIEKKDEYWKVFYDGETGYLNEMYLNITNSMATLDFSRNTNSSKSTSSVISSNYEITTLKMEGKLRNSDNAASDVIKYIPTGASVKVIENKGEYWKVFYDGKTGYLNEMYLNVTYNMSLLKK
jgi:clan AA aspartic protease (TIGR02281 family)